jgi:uncharacterized protein YcbK (DUF882 family)
MGDLSKNFNRKEFACKCGCGFDEVNPALIITMQWFRDYVDRPVVILSGCRCSKHNKAVGGVKESFHTKGMAADIRIPGASVEELRDLVENFGRFNGVGFYKRNGFVHVDVRKKRARWNG